MPEVQLRMDPAYPGDQGGGKLRDIFDEARENAPSLIFIDKQDPIVPRRGVVNGEAGRRVVAWLLPMTDAPGQPGADLVDEVFHNGGILKTFTFNKVRVNGKLSGATI
jgi:hypothetical protein